MQNQNAKSEKWQNGKKYTSMAKTGKVAKRQQNKTVTARGCDSVVMDSLIEP